MVEADASSQWDAMLAYQSLIQKQLLLYHNFLG